MTQMSYSLQQIADRCGVCRTTVAELIHAGELRALDIGTRRGVRSHFVVLREALEDFERNRAVVPRHVSHGAER